MPLTVISPSVCREIEILALFISCMCHDLDHRGTNNSFQVASVRENSSSSSSSSSSTSCPAEVVLLT